MEKQHQQLHIHFKLSMHITLHYIWFRIRDRIFQINKMVQAFLFPCILDLYCGRYWENHRL